MLVFHIRGTISRDYPYPAPVPQQATHKEGRGEAGMTDSQANSHPLTPVLLTLICSERKHSQKSSQTTSESDTTHLKFFKLQELNPALRKRHWSEIKQVSNHKKHQSLVTKGRSCAIVWLQTYSFSSCLYWGIKTKAQTAYSTSLMNQRLPSLLRPSCLPSYTCTLTKYNCICTCEGGYILPIKKQEKNALEQNKCVPLLVTTKKENFVTLYPPQKPL